MYEQQKSSFPIKWWCVAVVGFWLICGGLSAAFGGESYKFDSLSALFSGLAFAVLIGTLLHQRRDLAAQQADLEKTQRLLAETAEALRRTAGANEKMIHVSYLHEKISTLNLEIDKINTQSGPIAMIRPSVLAPLLEERKQLLEELYQLIKSPDSY